MCGTRYQLDARGAVLFLEDVGEPAYRLDRMLLQLRRAGVTDGVVGLALGRFTEQPDAIDYPSSDVLTEFATRLAVPTVIDLPFGHVEHNVTIPVGGVGLLDADSASLVLTEPSTRLG